MERLAEAMVVGSMEAAAMAMVGRLEATVGAVRAEAQGREAAVERARGARAPVAVGVAAAGQEEAERVEGVMADE